MRFYQMTTRTRLGALALGLLVLVVGGTLLAFGVVLLVGLAAVGLVIGGASMLWGKLTGRGPFGFLRHGRRSRLDPSREVFVVDEPAGRFGRYDEESVRPIDGSADGQIRGPGTGL